jgi:hypothetical protein
LLFLFASASLFSPALLGFSASKIPTYRYIGWLALPAFGSSSLAGALAFFHPSLDGLGLIVSHLGASDRNQFSLTHPPLGSALWVIGSVRCHSEASEGLEDD